MITSLFVPGGMIIYGWSAENKVFWIVPDIGIAIFCLGTVSYDVNVSM